MSTPSLCPSPQATAASRDGDDACPGALRLHAADDGALARIRIPGGVLRVGQAEALGRAARELGDGERHLTSRGNVQLRGPEAGSGGELAERLGAAGLLPSWRHERVRNVVASPLSGLDGRGFVDVRPWLRELDALLCASEAAAGRSGRFLFALDDGRGDVAGLGADVTVRAVPGAGALLRLGVSASVVSLRAKDVPRAALPAAEVFLEAAGGSAWRVSELGEEAAEPVSATMRRRWAPHPPIAPARQVTAEPLPGPVTAPDDTTSLSVLAPLGRLTSAQWAELTASAPHELRLTPWRGVILPASPASRLPHLEAVGLITDPTSARVGVGACIGRPGCARSHADVRTDGAAALGPAGPLPVYWSGCARRCGRPRGDHVDVVAEQDGGYRISVVRDGRALVSTRHNPSSLSVALAAVRTYDQ